MTTDARFWPKIDVLGGVADEESSSRLEAELRACDDQALEEFADTLHDKPHSLTNCR
ncbi:hypothetical protein [Nonomuraea solani]|uniref:hypothetical protein n=1 Tax=Nonomuraea solani TaxID=1144553 RepID=UPI00135BBF1E|nr:hypothetical protein [Nonomuraea solani]